jgi:hypothetical protein
VYKLPDGSTATTTKCVPIKFWLYFALGRSLYTHDQRSQFGDGFRLIEKGHVLEQLDILSVPRTTGVRALYRNGVVECDISLMSEVGERDCAVVYTMTI